MARRKRCSNCHELFDPGALTDGLCETCLLAAANEQAVLEAAQAEVDKGDATWADPEPPAGTSEGNEPVPISMVAGRYVLIDTKGNYVTSWDEHPGDDVAIEGFTLVDQGELAEGGQPTLDSVVEKYDIGTAADLDPNTPVNIIPPTETISTTIPPWVPAPSTQLDVQVYLGDPEETLDRRRDIPQADVPGWPLRKGYISASALATFVRCPEQFRRQYVLGEKRPSSGNAIAGSAAHTAVDVYYRCLIEQGQPAPRALWEEWLHARFDREKKFSYDIAGTVDWRGTVDEVRARAVKVADTFIRKVAPEIPGTPVASEQLFVRTIADVPVPLIGFLDVTTDEVTLDVKFGRFHNDLDAEWRLQGMVYLQAGLPVQFASVGWPKKDGTCSHAAHRSQRVARTAQNLRISGDLLRHRVRMILATAAEFGIAAPWPDNLTHQWACQSCHYRTHGCAWWPGAHPSPPVEMF